MLSAHSVEHSLASALLCSVTPSTRDVAENYPNYLRTGTNTTQRRCSIAAILATSTNVTTYLLAITMKQTNHAHTPS